VKPPADQVVARAQDLLGFLYQQGLGIAQDRAEAVKWFGKAADQGEMGAQYSLALAYQNGWGVERDYGEAAEWFRKAADQRYALGQWRLGINTSKATASGRTTLRR
jgi:TPR repeat protein